jgi:TM2 domain-containing membrane protein YozV
MAGLIVVRRATYWLQSDLTAHAKPANQAALDVITGQVLHGLFTVTLSFLIGGLIVVIVTLLSGPYQWAAAFRAWVRRAVASVAHLGSALAGHTSSDATVAWARRHLTILRIGGAVIAALALLIFSVNWIGFLIIAALLAVYEFGVHRLRQTEPSIGPPDEVMADAS